MAGVASRRTAETLIVQGRVTVNGKVVDTLGTRVDPAADDVRVDDRRVKAATTLRYIMLYKPTGYVTTRKDPEGRPTVLDLLRGVREYVYPVGRLDFDTEGLLLLTSDGDLAARLTHPRHGVERVYEATVAGAPDNKALASLREGVVIDGRRTAPARVMLGGTVSKGRHVTTRLVITLTEGRNRQVRQMCAVVGHPVRDLKRTKMGPLGLGGMRPGDWRDLTPQEVERLRATPLPGGR